MCRLFLVLLQKVCNLLNLQLSDSIKDLFCVQEEKEEHKATIQVEAFCRRNDTLVSQMVLPLCPVLS